ncbi:hypothetical protein IWQ61_010091, partial [Dispira simplex]
MFKSVNAAYIKEWWGNHYIPLATVIAELVKLEEIAESFIKLDTQIESLQNSLLEEGQTNYYKTGDALGQLRVDYRMKKSGVLGMLPAEPKKFTYLIDRIYDSIRPKDYSYMNDMVSELESIQYVRAILEDANTNNMDNPIIWVPFSDLADPDWHHSIFPFSLRGKAYSAEFYETISAAIQTLKSEKEAGAIRK